jgi:hypothetical protein
MCGFLELSIQRAHHWTSFRDGLSSPPPRHELLIIDNPAKSLLGLFEITFDASHDGICTS